MTFNLLIKPRKRLARKKARAVSGNCENPTNGWRAVVDGFNTINWQMVVATGCSMSWLNTMGRSWY